MSHVAPSKLWDSAAHAVPLVVAAEIALFLGRFKLEFLLCNLCEILSRVLLLKSRASLCVLFFPPACLFARTQHFLE